MKKRILSILLCLCMVLMLCPVTAFAEGEALEEITEIAVYDVKTPVIDEHPDYGSWLYSSTPSGVVNVGLQWYQISKEAYTGAAGDSWQLINSGYSCSKDYYYKAVFSVRVGNSVTETHTIPNTVKATINGETCDVQVAPDGKSCDLSRIFEAKELQPISNIAVTVDEPVIGAKPDYTPEFTATPEGSVTLDEFFWYKISEDDYAGTNEDAWDEISADDVFEEGYYYSVELFFTPNENYSLNEDMTAAVNGEPHDDAYGPVYDGFFGKAYVSGVFGPLVPQPTLKVPFTITVKQGSSAAPRKTVFELEIVNSQGDKLVFNGVEVTAAVTTNGKGTYKGTMTFTGSLEDLDDMLGEGAFVRQVDAGKANWTYDDTVWGLFLRNVAELADDAAPENTVFIFPATCEKTDDGGLSYSMVDGANPVERMTFTNTYTKSSTRPSENGTNTGTITSPQTGDNSNLTVWFALLAVSAAGVMGAGVYSKRRRSSR